MANNQEHQHPGTGLGAPKEPERTAEQLAVIHAAMMEELGVGRKDTLPLEDKCYNGHIPLTTLIKPKVPLNEGVARWHNIEFDDLDEATEQLDNIADGQLYRLRRGTSNGLSRGPSGRGGNTSSNTFRGGHGSSPARGASARGGRNCYSSGIGRGSSISPSGDARLNVMVSSSTPSTYFNDARSGINNHARIQKTIEMLKGTPKRNPAPTNTLLTLSKPSPFNSLANPQDFLKAMGLTAQPANVRAPAPSSIVEPQSTPLTSDSTPGTVILNATTTEDLNAPSQSAPSTARPTVTATAPVSSQPAVSITGGVSGISRATTPAFANRSTGLASFRWAMLQTAAAPLASLNSSVSTSGASVASSSILAAPTPATDVSAQEPSTTDASAPTNNSTALAVSALAKPVARPASSASMSASNVPTIVMSSPASADPSSPPLNFFAAPDNSDITTSDATILSGRSVLIEKIVKASKNDGGDRPAKGRLVRNLKSQIILEVEIGGVVQICEPMFSNVSFISTITSTSATITFVIGPDVYKLTFRFAHEASSFEQLLPTQLKKSSDTLSEQVAKTPVTPVVIAPAAISSVRPGSSADSLHTRAKRQGDAITVPTDSSTTINKSVAANDALLIDFSEEVHEEGSSQPQGAGSALDDLACLNTDPMVQMILSELNRAVGGSFLDQVSRNEVSEAAVLTAAEKIVDAFFRSSHIFRNLPDQARITYAKETSKDVLKMAQEQVIEARKSFKTEHARSASVVKHDALLVADDNYLQQVNNYHVPLTSGVKHEAFSALDNEHSLQANNDRTLPMPETEQEASAVACNNGTRQIENYHVSSIPAVTQKPRSAADDSLSHQSSQKVHKPQRSCKYSVQELVSLRSEASAVNESLISRTEELKIDGKLPKSTHRPSRVDTAAKFASKPYQELFQGRGSWDLKPTTSKAAAGTSTPQNLQALPQVSSEALMSSSSQYQQTDPALYSSLLSAIGQKKQLQAGSKGIHHHAVSKDLTGLISAFSDLKIETAGQAPAITTINPNKAVQTQLPVQSHLFTEQTGDVTQAESIKSFTQAQPIAQLADEASRTKPTPLVTQHKTILETSNKKEDMAKAKLPGLRASKWSIPSQTPPSMTFFPVQSPSQQHVVTGPEVIGSMPVIAHQLVFPPSQSENLGSQGFSPRSNMLDHRVSNTSSTASDFKPNFKNHPTSSNPSHAPLSPRRTNLQQNTQQILQQRLDRSLSKRN